MVTKDEVYVLIDGNSYKLSKSDILNSQADLLKIKKHLQNLRVLAREKKDLKMKLAKVLGSTATNIGYIQDKMPSPKIPKAVKREEEIQESINEVHVERDGIEDELSRIQEKLRELNS